MHPPHRTPLRSRSLPPGAQHHRGHVLRVFEHALRHRARQRHLPSRRLAPEAGRPDCGHARPVAAGADSGHRLHPAVHRCGGGRAAGRVHPAAAAQDDARGRAGRRREERRGAFVFFSFSLKPAHRAARPAPCRVRHARWSSSPRRLPLQWPAHSAWRCGPRPIPLPLLALAH
eukprot:scaffold35290_cov54-Isochrysis_galbana.AAC.1